MRKMITLLLLFFVPVIMNAQSNNDAIIEAGIALYDKGDYRGAVAKFDEALKNQPGNDYAMYEKSLALIRLRQYDEAEELLKSVLANSKTPGIRRNAYSNYGTVLDLNGKPKESLSIYVKGLKEFPDDNMIYFNKGITEVQLKDFDAATMSFKESVKLNPHHASSHNALARMTLDQSRIKGVLALFSFLLIEPEGSRAEENIKLLNNLIMKGVSKKDEKNVTINLDMGSLDKKKNTEDDFGSAELMLSLLAAHIPDSLQDKTDADKLHHQMNSLISVIDEKNKKDKGFFKNFYVPFFIEMKNKGMLLTACYVALTSSGKEDIYKWQNDNKPNVEAFLDWLDAYSWKKN